ncbi:MAG: hypothetical protein MR633_03740 [Faecalibacterium prausnitzii]|nr:hypothetical protein [Faecalibacterium prausnitzii]
MKKDGYKFKCKICSDGRLYEGGWAHESVIPDPLPFNEVLFDEFPETSNGGADYVWDGKILTYSPAAVEEPAPVQTADDGSEVSYS